MTKKKRSMPEARSLGGPLYIAVCNDCDWCATVDDPNKCLALANGHLDCEHGGESESEATIAMFVAKEEVCLKIQRKEEYVFGRE